MGRISFEISEIKHSRKTRRLEQRLLKQNGVVNVSIAPGGSGYIDWDDQVIDRTGVVGYIRSSGYQVQQIKREDVSPASEHDHEIFSKLLFLGDNTELYFAIASGVCWFSGLMLSFVTGVPELVSTVLFIVGSLFGGFFTFFTAGSDLLKGRLEIDFLMLFAAVGAALLGKWGEGALLLFLFSLGHALEHYAMGRARKSIAALSSLAPPQALVKRNGKLVEVAIEALRVGDIIVVKPNSKIGADGIVTSGVSHVDQASITGESIPVEKTPAPEWEGSSDINRVVAEHRVFAGTINGGGVLEVKVLKEAKDSTLSRLIELVREAESQKSPTQRLADNFEKYYVPVVLVLVLLLMLAFVVIDETFADSFYRAMSVLIAASPCALAISTPSAVLAGIARAARQGVLVKGGRPLEDLGGLQAIAFDKTGTLTQGKPTLTHAIAHQEVDRSKLLRVAVAVELLSDHPIAAAIVDGGRKLLGDQAIPPATNLQALTARGVKADLPEGTVHLGNRRLFEELTGKPVPADIDQQMAELEDSGHTAMIVHQGRDYLGIIAVMDTARPEAVATLAQLKKMGIKKMVMLTGDHQKVADAIAAELGITHPMGSLLPEDKVNAIHRLNEVEGNVAMVGDGVNDAPAMAKSTVGIAMGAAGSDVALETADIALMADKLDNLPFAIGLSRKAGRVIKQNLVISLGMVAILVPMTIMGTISIGPAVVGHEGSTILVVLNALRLLRYEVA